MWERGLSEDSWGSDLKVIAISMPFAGIRLCKFEGVGKSFVLMVLIFRYLLDI